jgi:hypothetical protein
MLSLCEPVHPTILNDMVECFVLYEDLLGAKALLDADSPHLTHWLTYVETNIVPWVSTNFPRVGFHRYSDNFSFTIEVGDDPKAAFHTLATISNWFHITALTQRLQYRGAIARGQMVILPSGGTVRDATNVTGRPLGDAHNYETAAVWGRCIIHDTAIAVATSSDLCFDPGDGLLTLNFASRFDKFNPDDGAVEFEGAGSTEVIAYIKAGLTDSSSRIRSKFKQLVWYLGQSGSKGRELAQLYELKD